MEKTKKITEKTTENPTEIIQKYILEGRQIVLKKENETSFVRIRFNNTDTDGTKKWRIIINGNEFHTAEIIINCQTRTLTEKFEDVGVKHHIVCDAKQIVFKNNIATIN
jgi:hypothetical protein